MTDGRRRGSPMSIQKSRYMHQCRFTLNTGKAGEEWKAGKCSHHGRSKRAFMLHLGHDDREHCIGGGINEQEGMFIGLKEIHRFLR